MEEFEKLYNKALKFLSYRPRSEKEVRDRLKLKAQKSKVKTTTQNSKLGIDTELLIDKVIQKLKEYKFIDDVEFAKKWIEQRFRFKPRSLSLIKLELKRKGVSEEIIESIIHDSQFIIQNDLEQAKKLVEKRIGRLKGLEKQEIYQKLGRYLASKGFNWDIIKKSIDEMFDEGV